jgi:hypothetical protein
VLLVSCIDLQDPKKSNTKIRIEMKVCFFIMILCF